jgi:hypothetical protein
MLLFLPLFLPPVDGTRLGVDAGSLWENDRSPQIEFVASSGVKIHDEIVELG